MKILFVCKRNNGRSQMAKGIYNHLTGSSDADSAGIDVDNEGQLLSERATEKGSGVLKVIQVMDEIGIDVRGFKRQQFNPNKVDDYDKIVFILSTRELPEAFISNSKFKSWNIPDPKTKDFFGVRQTRNEIHDAVKKLIQTNK